MQKIVISGGTGFIGRAVVAALHARGDEVTVLSRDPSRARVTAVSQVRFEAWDGQNAPASVDGADVVIHLAGQPVVGKRWSEAAKQEITDSRVRSTERLVNAMVVASRKPSVFVCASAIGYYGAHGNEPLDETAEAGSDFLARVTLAWEAAASRAGDLGIRVVRTRFGVVLGRGGGALSELARPFKMFVGGPIASGAQIVSWVHIDDAVGAVLRAIDDVRLEGPINVTAPEAVSNRELSDVIGRVLHRPAFVRVPELALRVALGEAADPLVSGQRAVPAVLERVGYAFRYPRVEDAVRQAIG